MQRARKQSYSRVGDGSWRTRRRHVSEASSIGTTSRSRQAASDGLVEHSQPRAGAGASLALPAFSTQRGGGVIGRGSACNMPGYGSSQRLKFGRWSFEHGAAIGRVERGDGVAKGWVLVQDPDGSQRSFWEAMASEASHGEGQPIDESAQVGDTLLRTPSQSTAATPGGGGGGSPGGRMLNLNVFPRALSCHGDLRQRDGLTRHSG